MASPSVMIRFFRGVGAAAEGAYMLAVRPRLWGWLAAPLLVNLLICILLGGFAIALVVQFSEWLHPHFAAAEGTQSWWAWSLEWLLFWIALAIAILPLLLLWKVLELILFGVAYARITESVERELLRPGETLQPLTMLQDFLDALFNAAILLLGFAFIFLLNFLPGVGTILSLVLGVLWGAFIQGLDLLGICRALRGDRRVRQLQFCRRHASETLGLGVVGFLFSFLPLIGPILIASCAVGAVPLHREIALRQNDLLG